MNRRALIRKKEEHKRVISELVLQATAGNRAAKNAYISGRRARRPRNR